MEAQHVARRWFALHSGPIAALARLCAGLILVASTAHAQGALSQLQTDVDQIARRARPSVVTVFSQSTLPGTGAASLRIHTRVGSGVAIEESAILTTASVVLGAERVLVRTANGIQVEAELAGMDPIYNVALLRVPEMKLPPLRFAEARPPQIGDWVIALGTSFRALPTQSVGTIAYFYREPRVPLLQLTNTVYPGNSGGAALNPRGELVGIVQGELGAPDFDTHGPDSERRPGGMSLVLPAETVRPVYESLRRDGRIAHGYLGVTTRAASVESDTHGDRVPLGAMVEGVTTDGPAQHTGLQRGDLIVAFDGERVEYPEQLARWVAATKPGSAVELVWVRNELRRTGRVVLSESSQLFPQWALGTPASDAGDPSLTRIDMLERRIRELNRELGRLKGNSSAVTR